MRTRDQYMKGLCTHAEFYDQFVSRQIIEVVRKHIGNEAIKNSYDPHFNDIPLNRWDQLEPQIRFFSERKVREAGDGWSLSTGVCIAKRAAAQIRGENAKAEGQS